MEAVRTIETRGTKWLYHFSVWFCYCGLLTWFFSRMHGTGAGFLWGGAIVGLQAMVFYLNVSLLLPRFFDRKRYVIYFLCSAILVFVTVQAFHLLHELIIGHPGPHGGHGRPENSRFLRHHPNIMMYGRMILSGISTVVILFISTIYRDAKEARVREKRMMELKNKGLEAEMKFLRSQINPHFLFNTLNNLYSLTLLKSERAPDMVLKLSDMLRYVLYEGNQDKVPLRKEIEYIRNYIDLFRMKEEQELNVDIEMARLDEKVMVAPLLFIPFIENSFKHGGVEEGGWIKGSIRTDKNELTFDLKNSIPEGRRSKDKTGGVGLKNVRRRLELAYPESYDLEVKEGEGEFEVNLTLQLS